MAHTYRVNKDKMAFERYRRVGYAIGVSFQSHFAVPPTGSFVVKLNSVEPNNI